MSRTEVTYATTTETITNGMRVTPSDCRNSTVSSTEVSGNRSIVTAIAPIPIATPATIGSPGRWDSATPTAAPMNIAGNVGPPRKLLSEHAYASDFVSTSSNSAPTVHESACWINGASALSPEKST